MRSVNVTWSGGHWLLGASFALALVASACGVSLEGLPTPCQGSDCGPGACSVDGDQYRDGTRGIPAGDGCNTCNCSDGTAQCTTMACNVAGNGSGGSGSGGSGSGGSAGGPGCEVGGVPYQSGAADIAAPDDCNTCACIDGELQCTLVACNTGSCTYGGVFYLDGDTFDAIDGCNTCSCSGGMVACTEKACIAPTACSADGECQLGEMCQKPTGLCGGEGECVVPSGACTRDYVPVCGCDGVTYGNECTAHAQGINVASMGECGVATGCGGEECDAQQYCELPVGSCGLEASSGQCSDAPTVCGEIYAPVCGCNGVTYDNECMAAGSGINVAYQGACSLPCFDHTSCGENQYCMFPLGVCGAIVAPTPAQFASDPAQGAAAPLVAAPSGVCVEIPGGCTLEYNPVCGCDGMTYGNSCGAASAGVSVAYEGECQTP